MYFGFLIRFPPGFSLRCSQLFQQTGSRASFCLLLDREGEKEALAESPLRSPKPELNWSILSFLLKLVFRQRTFFINFNDDRN